MLIGCNGWLAEYITIPADAAIVVPDNVNTESAATLAAAATTAWHCMVSFGGLKPSDLVLAPGTGGVSIVTLQLAKAMAIAVQCAGIEHGLRRLLLHVGAELLEERAELWGTQADNQPWIGTELAAAQGH